MDKEKDILEKDNPFIAEVPEAPEISIDPETMEIKEAPESPLKWGEQDMPEVPKVEIPTWEAPVQEEPVLEFSDGFSEKVEVETAQAFEAAGGAFEASVQNAAQAAEKPLNTTEQWIADHQKEKEAQAVAQAQAQATAAAEAAQAQAQAAKAEAEAAAQAAKDAQARAEAAQQNAANYQADPQAAYQQAQQAQQSGGFNQPGQSGGFSQQGYTYSPGGDQDPFGQSQQQAPYTQNYGGPVGQVGRKSKLVAGVLGILLGGLGIHKFYLGNTQPALIMLAVAIIGGIFTGGLLSSAMGIVGLVEGIIYLTKSDEEFHEIYEVGKKPWF